jgi:hypothetical protein
LPFRFAAGESAELLVQRLAALNWRAAIIGPHGSGKSTLLETLKPAIQKSGHCVHSIVLRDGQRRLPGGFLTPSAVGTLAVVDGYEQLSRLERLRLSIAVRRTGCGVLVTAHAPTQFATLMRTNPTRSLAHELVAELAARVSTSITPADVAASHACHGSNFREIFFDLYARHEQWRRAERMNLCTTHSVQDIANKPVAHAPR